MHKQYLIKYPVLLPSLILFCLIPINIECQVQKNVLNNISEKFQTYCKSFPWEEIYVHTDRQEYVAGEYIWLETYLIDRQSSKISGDSRIAYIEILNPENRPVAQKRIRLEQGTGPGQLVLPDTLSPGYYTLRAYTSWMKNFLPVNCFTKTLKIYNALSTRSFISNSGAGEISLKSVPPGEPGISVEINKSKPDIVEVIIRTDQIYRIRNGSNCYMFIHTHGNINSRRAVSVSGDNTVIDVPREQLISGINHITIFNASGRPVAERFILTEPAHLSSTDVTLPDNAIIREKISLGINLDKKSVKENTHTNISVSISEAGRNEFPDISDYMIFGSEFGDFPSELLKSGLKNVSQELLEKYLSEIKSNWIDWKKVLSDTLQTVKYQKETKSHFIYGKLLNRSSQIPDADKFLFLSMPGKNATFQYALTDSNGYFCFELPLDEKIRDLIIQPEEASWTNNIKIETSFSDKYPVINHVPDTIINAEQKSIPKLGINYQVMKIYSADEMQVKSEPLPFTGGSKRFYGKPDIELVMDDYIKLPVMQEVFFELMPGVFMKKKKNKYEITITDPVENKIYEKPPKLFIDGVVVNDPDLIANLDPEKVEKIDAVKSRYFVGNYLFYGIVNVITRAGDLSNITLPEYAVRLPYRITEPVKAYTTPEYSSEDKRQSRIPDFRNTLYWNPSVKPDKEGKANIDFWTSDYKSDFEVNIQGVTGDGEFVTAKKIIKVR